MQGWKIINFAWGFENILRPIFYAFPSVLLLALKCLQPNKYQNSGIHLIRTKKNTKGRIIQCRPKNSKDTAAYYYSFRADPLPNSDTDIVCTMTILVYMTAVEGLFYT